MRQFLIVCKQGRTHGGLIVVRETAIQYFYGITGDASQTFYMQNHGANSASASTSAGWRA